MALDFVLAQLCVPGIWKEWRTINLREIWKNTVGDNLARKRGLDKIGYLKQTVEAIHDGFPCNRRIMSHHGVDCLAADESSIGPVPIQTTCRTCATKTSYSPFTIMVYSFGQCKVWMFIL